MTNPIRVFIADDHALFRQGLRQLLATDLDIAVVGEAPSATETLRQIRQSRLDVLILDLSMPGNEGVEIVKQIKRLNGQLPVMVLSMYADSLVADRAIRAGASGYLTKDCDANLLFKAIRKLAQGGQFVDPTLVDSLVFQAREDDQPAHAALSDREYQIFQLIAAGHSLTDIAQQLHISPKTVSTYKNRLMQKLGVDSVAALVRYAVKNQC